MSHRRRIVLVVLGLLAAALVPLAAAPPAMAAGTVTVSVQGFGTVTGDGISCNQSGEPDCSEPYSDTTTTECDPELKPPCHDVTETAVASFTAGAGTNGYVFDHWNGCESPSGATCTHTVSSNVTITAVYRDNQAPTVAAPSVSPPTPASGLQRGTVTLSTTAGDNSGSVTKVEFYNNLTKLGEDTSSPYSLTWDTTTVADGAKSITAKAYDPATFATTSAATGFTVDNTAPATSVTAGPANLARVRTPTVHFEFTSTEEGSTFGCRVYQPSVGVPIFLPCDEATSHGASNLADGTYVFDVVATDQAGNADPTPATRRFTVDTVAPQTTIRTGPPSVVLTAGRTARSVFAFGSERGATFRCKLDAQAWKSCASRPAYTVGLGAHVLRVKAVDRAGNEDRTPAVRRWTVRRR